MDLTLQWKGDVKKMSIAEYAERVIFLLKRKPIINNNNTVVTAQYNGYSGQYNIYIHNMRLKRFWVYNITGHYTANTSPVTVYLMILGNYMKEIK